MIPLRDNLSCKVRPWATWLLILLNVAAFGIELMVPADQIESFFMTWAVVPEKVSHAFASGSPALIGMAMLSVLTSMFLHGGWSHIIGNMIFLNAFGRAVEGRLGVLRYLGFYLLGGFAAWGLHMFTDPMSAAPALGASGAIAAVLGAYLVFYPKAEFKTLFITPLPILAIVRAYWLLMAWFILQLVDGVGGLIGPASGGVAYWAHIGGFLFGSMVAGAIGWFWPVSSVCYAPLACDCTCSSGNCNKSHNHRWELWGMKFFANRNRGGNPPCNGGGNHNHHS